MEVDFQLEFSGFSRCKMDIRKKKLVISPSEVLQKELCYSRIIPEMNKEQFSSFCIFDKKECKFHTSATSNT